MIQKKLCSQVKSLMKHLRMVEKLNQLLKTGTFDKFELLKKDHAKDIDESEWKIKTHKAVKRISHAEAVAKIQPILTALKPLCQKIEMAGSLRRKTPLVADADILILTTSLEWVRIKQVFSTMANIIKSGDSKIEAIVGESKIIGQSGKLELVEEFQVDLTRVDDSWGTALLHYTGSKAYNIQCRAEALKQGYSLNQYGISDKKFDTEKEALNFLGLPFTEPQDR